MAGWLERSPLAMKVPGLRQIVSEIFQKFSLRTQQGMNTRLPSELEKIEESRELVPSLS